MPGNKRTTPQISSTTPDAKSPYIPSVETNTYSKVPASGKNYIISIGIDKYNCPEIPDFVNGNCSKDCKDFADILVSDYEDFKLYGDILTNERATREDILQRIQSFIDDETLNKTENSLIVYFSGHGGEVKAGPTNVGCLIPHGCTKVEYKQVLPYDQIKSSLRQLNTQHIIFISDACNAAKLFDEMGLSPQIGSSKKVDGHEISRWAVVSSRSDELSVAGGPNQNSKFTEVLIRILKTNSSESLMLTDVIAELVSAFHNDESQKPFHGRMTLDSSPNSGIPEFKSNKNILDSKNRSGILSSQLTNLNYKDQLNELTEFKDRKHIAVISGTPHCGLNFLAFKIRKSVYFPPSASVIKPFVTSSLNIEGTGDARLVNIFGSFLSSSFSGIAQLREYIFKMLLNSSIIFELRFYRDPGVSEENIRPTDKKRILDELAQFVSTINENFPGSNSLILFVIDQEECDYKPLYNSNTIGGIKTFFLPLVQQMTLNEARGWYMTMRSQFEMKRIDLEQFDYLFKQKLFEKMETIVRDTKGYPGNMVRMICKESQCESLADLILEPTQ